MKTNFIIQKIFSLKSIKRAALNAIYISFVCTIFSFRVDSTVAPLNNHTVKDSIDSSKLFKNLINSPVYDPSKPFPITLNPKVKLFVEDYTRAQSKGYEDMKTWGQQYFNIYDKILSQSNLPVQLKYLSVIESSLQANMISNKGAVGPWQLMPDEANRYGLRVSGTIDDRTDFIKSTEVASKILKDLYNEFGDWLLVIAAYNAGEGAVKNAIAKSGSKDFYELQYNLPEETRDHVKKFIGTHYIFEGNGGYTTMTAAETKLYDSTVASLKNSTPQKEIENTSVVEISGKYNSLVVAKTLFMDIAMFNDLNPQIDKKLAEGETYNLRLPNDKMELFKAKRQQILQESVQLLFSSLDN